MDTFDVEKHHSDCLLLPLLLGITLKILFLSFNNSTSVVKTLELALL